MRYEIQEIKIVKEKPNFRITDTRTDSRIATCYLRENAEFVCEALNLLDQKIKKSNQNIWGGPINSGADTSQAGPRD